MKLYRKNIKPFGILALTALTCISNAFGADESSGSSTNGMSPSQYALALLKPVADKLAAAKTFSFKTESMVEVPSPVGQMIDYFFNSEMLVERPNRLASKKSGDGPSFETFYDGKTFVSYDKKLNLYAEMPAPPTLDELIPAVMEKTGHYFPSADVLYSDVYGNLTNGLTHAYWVNKSAINGVECNHLAFAGPGIEWQIWIGPEKDPLPRRLAVTLLSVEHQPQFMVTFSDWNLKAHASDKDFEFKKPADAKMIEFHPIMSGNK